MKRGFTLLEMLVVVLIISILASIAFVYYGRFLERMRMAEADMTMGHAILSQERVRLKFQNYTIYWHKLDAPPAPVRNPQAGNDYANGEENTIYYTRGGMAAGEPKTGFAISFKQNIGGSWFVVAQRVGKGGYTYRLVRPFDATQSVCVPDSANEKDVAVCIDYMHVERAEQLPGDPMQQDVQE